MANVYIGQASGTNAYRSRTAGNLEGQLNVSPANLQQWTYIYRPVKKSWAEYMAQCMYRFICNNNILYSQTSRRTYWTQLINNNYNIEAITTTCYCDCSSLTFGCFCMAAKYFRNLEWGYYAYVTSQIEQLMNETQLLTRINYNESAVKRGDILWRSGHCCIALNTYSQGIPTIVSDWGSKTVVGGYDSLVDIPVTYHAYVSTPVTDEPAYYTNNLWFRTQANVYDNNQYKEIQVNIHI